MICMAAVISAPVKWIESVGDLKLPPKANKRLQELMDRNNEGQLSASERRELEALVELSIGRATLRALDFNNARRLKIREAEAMFGLFPPRP